MKKSEIIDYLVEQLLKDKEVIKENLLHYTDRISLALDGYVLELKLRSKYEKDRL